MSPKSLFHLGRYTLEWVKDFYDQAGVWWGAESEVPAEDLARAETIARLCGPGPKRVLELGAGSGNTAAAMADCGHAVTALELSPVRAAQARRLLAASRPGSLEILEADFYTVQLAGPFDVVCYWDGFGIGSDADHRRLFRRVAGEWLAPRGSFLLDVANPAWAVQHAGLEERLKPLVGVPGSVEMIRRSHFDPLRCRWIDEWQPAAHPEHTLAQTVRCYTPADFCLLLEGTGLALQRVEVAGQPLDFACAPQAGAEIATAGPLLQAYSYLAQCALA